MSVGLKNKVWLVVCFVVVTFGVAAWFWMFQTGSAELTQRLPENTSQGEVASASRSERTDVTARSASASAGQSTDDGRQRTSDTDTDQTRFELQLTQFLESYSSDESLEQDAEWWRFQGFEVSEKEGDLDDRIYLSKAYDAYESEVLVEMANNGDIGAALVAAERLFDRLDASTWDESEDLYRQAVAMGSSYAARSIGEIYRASNDSISSLAWNLVAADMGDVFGSISAFVAQRDKTVGTEGMHAACVAASKIHTEITLLRNDIGHLSYEPTPMPSTVAMRASAPERFVKPCAEYQN